MKSIISIFVSIITFFNSLFLGLGFMQKDFRIVVPENWELVVGESRTLETVFGNDVENRELKWRVKNKNIAEIDKFGRVTAKSVGSTVVKATGKGFSDSVKLNVVATPTLMNENEIKKTDYTGNKYSAEHLQKIVTRYKYSSPDIPSALKGVTDYSELQSAKTADGALWKITDYGVLRINNNEAILRDREQRFMGERYFYSNDTTDGKVLGIMSDGSNGIWTMMADGVTHIELVDISAKDKANTLSEITNTYISRHGLTDAAYKSGEVWKSYQSDNDGLWTSMQGAGELMRYASLKNDPTATKEEIEQARKSAYSASEAVLMLYYISMRSGTAEAYVRHQTNKRLIGDSSDRFLSAEALEKGANPTFSVPCGSPADQFIAAKGKLHTTFNADALLNKGFFETYSDGWSNPAENPDKEYEKQKRNIEWFPVRTYYLKQEDNSTWGNIYFSVNDDKTATGVSSLPTTDSDYLLNNENLRGYIVDASKEIPERLWNDVIGSQYKASDVVYKCDTSADELVGHMFIFKLMNDILCPEDPELKELLVDAVNGFAQHMSENNYMLCDATGQPTSWGNFGRTVYCSGTSIAQSPLHTLVLLDIFKTAAYITGYQKWEDEYRMAAFDRDFEYAEIASQYSDRVAVSMEYTIGNETAMPLATVVDLLRNTTVFNTLRKLILNYSDEEMAMLAFYNIFQLEKDEKALYYYRSALNQWWESIQYSENPLYYIIYQTAFPNDKIEDYYGNNIIETATWSLGRHPMELIDYGTSNNRRDDLASLDLRGFGLKASQTISYKIPESGVMETLDPEAEIKDMVAYVLKASQLEISIAAPDERNLKRFNQSSYNLNESPNSGHLFTSTTYTLPYWMGVYHNIIK